MTLRYKLALLAVIVAGAVIGGCSSGAGVVNPSAQAPGARQGALSPAGRWGGASMDRTALAAGRQRSLRDVRRPRQNQPGRAI